MGRISKLIVAELNDEPFSRELLSCVKVYLWRHVKYDSHLRVAQNVINNSLSKSNGLCVNLMMDMMAVM